MEAEFPNAAPAEPENKPAAVRQYDIFADRQQMNERLVNSDEVDALVSKIEVYNLETILKFGAEAAKEISKASDLMLKSMTLSQSEGSGEMLHSLAKIMEKFDLGEIREDDSFFGRVFGNNKKQTEKIVAKYHTMGEELDRIYVQLKAYESEIKQSNRKIAAMFDANVNYYHELVKYILAGEQACREIEAHIDKRRRDMEISGDQSIEFELTSLKQALLAMEQRTQDLRMSENVALQSIPMLKTMEFNNYNLARQIDTAFLVTLPVFKQAIAQAILLKRQKIQSESMAALNSKMNEMLEKKAKKNREISKQTAGHASAASARTETLESTLRTIMNGIGETRRIEENARKKRIEDQSRLEAIKADVSKTL